MEEMIDRDKNRACVLIWSVANEPSSQLKEAGDYFASVANHTRAMDPFKRPVGIVLNQDPNKDHAAQHFDIVGINKYFGWYQDTGRLDLITNQMVHLISSWKEKHPNLALFVAEVNSSFNHKRSRQPIFSKQYF